MSRIKIYVSNNGNDANAGTIDAPIATLVKASEITQNKSIIYLECGSVFTGDPLEFYGKKKINVDKYGTGDTPVLSGIFTVPAWTDEGGNIWSYQSNNLPDEITNVFIGGTKALVARTANKTSTAGTATTLTDTTLADADGYWDGAELVIWPYDWTRGIVRVTTYAGKVFTYLQGYYNYSSRAGITYWIQNHKNCLTTQNTWAYNNTTKTIYLYSTTTPTSVQISLGSNAIYAENCHGLSIKNLQINHACQCGINIDECGSVEIDNVNFIYSGIYSMLLQNSTGIRIVNCTGLYQNNDFININKCYNIYISDNIGRFCGIDTSSQRYLNVPGPGGSGGLSVLYSKNLVVRYNEIAYTAYSAMNISYTDNPVIENNYVHHFNINKYDGGGIYMVHSGRHFFQNTWNYPVTRGRCIRNIVTEGNIGQNSDGIYPDNNSQDLEIAYNTVISPRYGYHLHDVALLNVHDNVVIGQSASIANIYLSLLSTWDIRNIINGNTFISQGASIPSLWVSAVTYIETIINNLYYRPSGSNILGVSGKMFRIGNSYYTYAEWLADESRATWTRTGESLETPSVADTGLLSLSDLVFYKLNPTKESIEIASTDVPYDDYLTLEGTEPSYPISVAAYSSAVLIRAPKPQCSYARKTNTSEITIYTDLYLNESIVPATSAFANDANTITNVSIADNTIVLTTTNPVTTSGVSYTKPVTNPLTSLYGAREMDSFTDTTGLVTLTVTAQNDGGRAGFFRLQAASEDVVMTLDGNGYFVDSYTGGNPVQTKTILAGGGTTNRDFYIMVSSGVSNLTFDKIQSVTQFKRWYTPYTNCPSLGGDISKAINLNLLILEGYNTISGDITPMTSLTQVNLARGCVMSGNFDNHILMEQLQISAAGCTCTLTSTARMKGLYLLNITNGLVLLAANVNAILNGIVLNKDEFKSTSYSNRTVVITGATGSEAPTGQGILDKATLQAYRSPFNDSTKSVWTVTTR